MTVSVITIPYTVLLDKGAVMKEFSSYYYAKVNDRLSSNYADIGYFEPHKIITQKTETKNKNKQPQKNNMVQVHE